MMNTLKWMIILLLSVGLLVGCGDKEKAGNKDNVKPTSSQNHGESKKSGKDDQLDLHIGDTGTVKTKYLGTFEVTLHSIKMPKLIGDSKPDYDSFVIADVTVKNIGDSEIKLDDITKQVNLIDLGEDSGSVPDYASQIPGTQNPLSTQGTLGPGKSTDGVLVFDVDKTNKYQLIFGYPDVGLMNQVVWTFTPDEAK